MTLLQKGKNSQIGNKSWTVKKPIIAASNYRINKSIGEVAIWDKKQLMTEVADLQAVSVGFGRSKEKVIYFEH